MPQTNRPGAADAEPRWFASSRDKATVPFPYVPEPLASWVHDEVDRQVALGNLVDLHAFTRPLPRTLIAARVAEALAAGKRSVGLSRLARELAWELRVMGLDPECRDSRPMVSLGPPESFVKFNGLVTLGGDFEKGEEPRVGQNSFVGFRGQYWGVPGFALMGEYGITEVDDAGRFGDPVVSGTEFQYVTPRFAADWHGKWFQV